MSRAKHWHPKTLKSIREGSNAYNDASDRMDKHGVRYGQMVGERKHRKLDKIGGDDPDPMAAVRSRGQYKANSVHKKIDKHKARQSLKGAAKHVLKQQHPYKKLSKQNGYRG